MTVQEFSDQFDVQFNNITSNQAPGLNEYEKSVFLTKGQDEVIKNYFNPKANPKGDGFDDSPKRQVDFSSIIRTGTLTAVTASNKFDQRSLAYKMPTDLFISLNEQLMSGGIPYTVMPISYQEYDRMMSKPYKYPPKYTAWRLITENASVDATISSVTAGFKTGTITTASKYGKPVRLIVNATAGNSVEPIIEETSSLVTITMVVGKTIVHEGSPVDIDNTSDYWNYYLSGTSRECVTDGYLETWTGASNHSSFPAIAIGSGWTDETICDFTNNGGTSSGMATVAEIIGRFPGTITYRMRYIKRPSPIILAPLLDGLSIHGATAPQTSELPEEIHEEILQRAVELAKVSWTATGQENVQLVMQAGQRSE